MTSFASLANPISERNAELSLLREKRGRDVRSFKNTTGFLFIQSLMPISEVPLSVAIIHTHTLPDILQTWSLDFHAARNLVPYSSFCTTNISGVPSTPWDLRYGPGLSAHRIPVHACQVHSSAWQHDRTGTTRQ